MVRFFLIFSWRISFLLIKDIDMGSHTGDSTPFVVENNIVNALEFLEQVSDAFLN